MGFKASLWLFWFIGTLCGAAALVTAMISPGHQWPFLIGETSSGHYQIELACKACHLTPFGGKEALQQSCIDCHGEELKLAKDSHPAKKFNDPRNADRLEKLNAQLCLTCHREHKPRLTNAIGVTVPDDFCRLCHETIGEERPSHKGLSFSGCAASGCRTRKPNRLYLKAPSRIRCSSRECDEPRDFLYWAYVGQAVVATPRFRRRRSTI